MGQVNKTFTQVAKYHLGKVKFEQMQPAVFLICNT